MLPLTKIRTRADIGGLDLRDHHDHFVDLWFTRRGEQHPARRWEYSMAMHAYETWLEQQGELHAVHRPFFLDVGGAGSPLSDMIRAADSGTGFMVVDPKSGTGTLHEFLQGNWRPADAVFCISTVEHVEDLWEFCDDLVKAVRPGGLIFLTSDIWNADDKDDDKAHWHWDRRRIFTPGKWQHLARHFDLQVTVKESGKELKAGAQLLGEADFSWPGDSECLENWGYNLCSMAVVRR